MFPRLCIPCLKLRLNNFFSHGVALVCEACAEVGCTPADPKRYTCTGSGCGKEFGCRRYDKCQLEHFKQRGGVLLCKNCRACQPSRKSEEASQLRELRKKAAVSKRKGCTCGRRMGHAEKCPMHARAFGENPYPWCAVMTRKESDWLQANSKKRTA